MKETYVSFEVAELLKKKGFDEPCMAFWEYELSEYSLHISSEFPINNSKLEKGKEFKGFSAPTHQMACAWIRDKYGLHIFADYIIKFKVWHRYVRELKTGIQWSIGGFSSPEEAIEEGIKFTLENLI